ncbi:hypothetical protein BU15DRAFT_66698 [Melanogaster broomeanus]|nr:hypothetical protein BU15DRAFT_66698 [Melanogaster broomeanus]
MFKWMDVVDCTTKYETTLRQRQDETCKWLFDLKRYSDWCSSRNPFLRLCGKPGSGKSVLISAVIDSLSTTETDGGVLAYFYCDFRMERSTHAFEVIRSLVTQLLVKSNKDWLPLFNDLVKRKSKREPPPVDLEILYPLLLKALQLHNRPVLVIDALDECNDYVKLTLLLACLHSEGSCRVLTTSRRLPDAPKTFSNLPIIDLDGMSAETQRDMKLHVEKEIAKCKKLAHLHGKIVPSLLEKANGMFRWVQCQLDRLRGCRTTSNVQEVLDTFPIGLCQTYDRILSDIDKKPFDGRIVKSALLWLVGALRPLCLRMLVEAVTLDMQGEFLPDADILDICRGLVSYNETHDIVSLSHFSVKEYLFDEQLCMGTHSHYRLSSSIANSHIAKVYIDHFRTPQVISQRHDIRFKTLQDDIENFGRDYHLSRIAETKESPQELMQSMPILQEAQSQCCH